MMKGKKKEGINMVMMEMGGERLMGMENGGLLLIVDWDRMIFGVSIYINAKLARLLGLLE